MPAPKGHEPYPDKEGNLLGGRPEKYSNEFIETESEAFYKWMEKPENIYFKSFAIERGYSPKYLVEFAKTNKRFSECLVYAHEWQEQKLANYGLFNKTNSSITKFVLQNCHGWAEKSQVSGDANNPLSFVLNTIDGTTKDLIDEPDTDSD